jgi:O-antigen/teichoic acid export membrane protein
MTTEQIGIVNLYSSWYTLISVVATLALTSGGFAVAMKEFEDRRNEYQSSLLSLTSMIAVVLFGIYIIDYNFWNKITGLSTNLMLLMFVGFLFAPARDFWFTRERYEYRYKIPAIITLLSAFLASVCSVLVVLYYNQIGNENTAVARLTVNYLIIYAFAAGLWIFIMIKGKKIIDIEFWIFSLKLSLPLVGYNIAAQILSVSDRLMISRIVNNSAVGIYSTLYTVSSISTLIWQSINSSFVPYLFKNIEKKENQIKKISFVLLFVYASLAVILTFMAPEIVKILAPKEYYEAIYIMPPIAAGVFFTSLAQMYSNIAVYYKKTQYVMYPAIIAAVLNIFLNYICISKYGYMAAAYTTLVSYIVWAIIQLVMGNHISLKYCKSKIYDDKKIVLTSAFTLIICLCTIPLYSYTLLRYMFIGIFIMIDLYIIVKYLKNKE